MTKIPRRRNGEAGPTFGITTALRSGTHVTVDARRAGETFALIEAQNVALNATEPVEVFVHEVGGAPEEWIFRVTRDEDKVVQTWLRP